MGKEQGEQQVESLYVETYSMFKKWKGVWCGRNGISKADSVGRSEDIREYQKVTLDLVGASEESGFYSEHKEFGSGSEHDEKPLDGFTQNGDNLLAFRVGQGDEAVAREGFTI